MARIVILGAGMMGSAAGVPFADNGHEVRLVGTHLDAAIIKSILGNNVHPGLNCALPELIQAYTLDNLTHAVKDAELLILGVSSHGVRWAARTISPFIHEDLPVIMVTKGLEWDGSNFLTMPHLLQSLLPEKKRKLIEPAAIAGPCIAGELARRVETCVIFAGQDNERVEKIAALARNNYYHVFTSTDATGVEMCAALKNAFAMAVGFGAGRYERIGGAKGSSVAMHNYEAAIFAQASFEMMQFVEANNGKASSVCGLAGVGDLQVTCQGGRTSRFGRLLGLGLTIEEAVEEMEGTTLECLFVIRELSKAVPHLIKSGRLDPFKIPLTRHLIEIVVNGSPVSIPFEQF